MICSYCTYMVITFLILWQRLHRFTVLCQEVRHDQVSAPSWPDTQYSPYDSLPAWLLLDDILSIKTASVTLLERGAHMFSGSSISLCSFISCQSFEKMTVNNYDCRLQVVYQSLVRDCVHTVRVPSPKLASSRLQILLRPQGTERILTDRCFLCKKSIHRNLNLAWALKSRPKLSRCRSTLHFYHILSGSRHSSCAGVASRASVETFGGDFKMFCVSLSKGISGKLE